MTILEDHAAWRGQYEQNWLAEFETSGSINWKIYNRPRNAEWLTAPGIDLRTSRLLLISSAGGYLPDQQTPFDADNDLGDYTIRPVPTATDPADLAFAHTHYDHTAVNRDAQVLVPLGHLRALVDAGVVGSLTDRFINFMGYQPDVTRVLDEMIPAILALAKDEQADAALLVPS